jgi:CubicO group peptidase (beta-lactamase class C family)
MTGMIIRNGYLVQGWGEPMRVDMTHSVTKSFLSATIGIAYDRKLIRDLKSPVYKEMAPITNYSPRRRYDDPEQFGKAKFLELFETDHNKTIDWDSLLRQTSDWEGTLFGKPDWADRPDRDSTKWLNKTRNRPGSAYEYNDVRVNLLALAALNMIREPLPKYLRENLMDRIGASSTWRWHGYENSYVLIDGQIIQSVSGGGHWGGGMFINAHDMARFGLLIENGGVWDGSRLLSAEFLKMAETPTAVQPTYGFMNFFLNTYKKLYPSAPEGTIAFLGNGTNMVYIDKKSDLVIVARWIEGSKIDGFLKKVYEAMAD